MKLDVDEAPYNVRSDWSRVSVLEVVHPRNLDYDGKTITEMAKMTGKDSLDAFLGPRSGRGAGNSLQDTGPAIPPMN